MATRIPYDFATAGDTEEVPSVSSTDELSFQSGWTDAYEKDSSESGYRYISRSEHNYLWNVITSNIREWQQQAYPDWISDELDSGTPYAYDTGAIVRYTDGLNYVSLVDSNTGEPSVSSNWKVFGSSNLMDLTTDQSTSGVKTFTESPIVPTPTTDYQAATKEYVDDSFPYTTISNANGEAHVYSDGFIRQFITTSSGSGQTVFDLPVTMTDSPEDWNVSYMNIGATNNTTGGLKHRYDSSTQSSINLYQASDAVSKVIIEGY